MPRKVHPDWRVIISNPKARKAIVSGRGLDNLTSWEQRIAPSLHRYLSKTNDGQPLPSEQQLARRNELTWRQFAAARRILAAHLWETIKDFRFQMVNGQDVTFMVAFGPTEVYEAIKDLKLGVHAHHFTDEILKNRPDVAIPLLERWAAEAEAVAKNPKNFPSARKEFAANAAELRAKIAELNERQPYLGRGRRRVVDHECKRAFVNQLAEWLAARPHLIEASDEEGQVEAVSEVIDQIRDIGSQTGCPVDRIPPGSVSAVLFEGRKTPVRNRAMRLAVVALGVSYETIRKLV